MPLSATASGGGSQYKSNPISSSFLNKILPQTSIFHHESVIYDKYRNLPIDNLSTLSVPGTVSISCVVFWVERVNLHILKLFKYVFHGMNNLEFSKFFWNGVVQGRLYSIYLVYSFFSLLHCWLVVSSAVPAPPALLQDLSWPCLWQTCLGHSTWYTS